MIRLAGGGLGETPKTKTVSSRSTFSLTTFSLNFHIKGRLICVLIDTVSQPTGKVSGWRQLGKYVVTSRKLFFCR